MLILFICACSSQATEQAANSGQPQLQQPQNYSPNPETVKRLLSNTRTLPLPRGGLGRGVSHVSHSFFKLVLVGVLTYQGIAIVAGAIALLQSR